MGEFERAVEAQIERVTRDAEKLIKKREDESSAVIEERARKGQLQEVKDRDKRLATEVDKLKMECRALSDETEQLTEQYQQLESR